MIKETLIQSKALISDKSTWLQNEFARDIFNKKIDSAHPNAQKFCLLGALINTTHKNVEVDEGMKKLLKVMDFLHKSIPSITNFNDDPARTHKEILEFLNEQIVLADGI